MKNMAPEVYNFRAAATQSALKLWTKHGIKPNRWTKIRDLLDIATIYTGVTYKISKKDQLRALEDLTKWIEECKT